MSSDLDSIFFRLHTRSSRAISSVVDARARRFIGLMLIIATILSFSGFMWLHVHHVLHATQDSCMLESIRSKFVQVLPPTQTFHFHHQQHHPSASASAATPLSFTPPKIAHMLRIRVVSSRTAIVDRLRSAVFRAVVGSTTQSKKVLKDDDDDDTIPSQAEMTENVLHDANSDTTTSTATATSSSNTLSSSSATVCATSTPQTATTTSSSTDDLFDAVATYLVSRRRGQPLPRFSLNQLVNRLRDAAGESMAIGHDMETAETLRAVTAHLLASEGPVVGLGLRVGGVGPGEEAGEAEKEEGGIIEGRGQRRGNREDEGIEGEHDNAVIGDNLHVEDTSSTVTKTKKNSTPQTMYEGAQQALLFYRAVVHALVGTQTSSSSVTGGSGGSGGKTRYRTGNASAFSTSTSNHGTSSEYSTLTFWQAISLTFWPPKASETSSSSSIHSPKNDNSTTTSGTGEENEGQQPQQQQCSSPPFTSPSSSASFITSWAVDAEVNAVMRVLFGEPDLLSLLATGVTGGVGVGSGISPSIPRDLNPSMTTTTTTNTNTGSLLADTMTAAAEASTTTTTTTTTTTSTISSSSSSSSTARLQPESSFIYSSDRGLLTLSPQTRDTLHVVMSTLEIPVACVGGPPLSRWLMETFAGHDTAVLNAIVAAAKGKGYVMAEHNNGEVYALSAANEVQEFTSSIIGHLILKLGTACAALFLVFASSSLVSFILAQTQQRMLRFTASLQHVVRARLPLLPLVAAHLVDSLVFVPIMLGVLFFLFEFFADQLLAFLVLLVVWFCELWSITACRTGASVSIFPRAYGLLLTWFHAYYLAYPFGYQYGCLATTALGLFSVAWHLWSVYELPALERGEISSTSPRSVGVIRLLESYEGGNGNTMGSAEYYGGSGGIGGYSGGSPLAQQQQQQQQQQQSLQAPYSPTRSVFHGPVGLLTQHQQQRQQQQQQQHMQYVFNRMPIHPPSSPTTSALLTAATTPALFLQERGGSPSASMFGSNGLHASTSSSSSPPRPSSSSFTGSSQPLYNPEMGASATGVNANTPGRGGGAGGQNMYNNGYVVSPLRIAPPANSADSREATSSFIRRRMIHGLEGGSSNNGSSSGDGAASAGGGGGNRLRAVTEGGVGVSSLLSSPFFSSSSVAAPQVGSSSPSLLSSNSTPTPSSTGSGSGRPSSRRLVLGGWE